MPTMRVGIAIAIAALLLQGCVQTTPKWDRQFGDTVRANLAAQVLDPAAAANPNPATGIDGRAAAAAQERYEKSFANPKASTTAPLINTMGSTK
jgi:type IV pilus biogenesis protein CpaD/CtpE